MDEVRRLSMDEGVAKQEGDHVLVIWEAVQRMWAGVVLARASQDIRSPWVRASLGVGSIMFSVSQERAWTVELRRW